MIIASILTLIGCLFIAIGMNLLRVDDNEKYNADQVLLQLKLNSYRGVPMVIAGSIMFSAGSVALIFV